MSEQSTRIFEEEQEIWKDIDGYNGYYSVSNLGRIRNNIRNRIFAGNPNARYPNVTLSKRGKSKQYSIHKLVLTAFIGPRPPGMEACHFPDKKTNNNRLSNLRWDNKKSNAKDRDIHGNTVRGERSPVAKLTWNKVREIRKLLSGGMTQIEVAKMYGVRNTTISYIENNITWKENDA